MKNANWNIISLPVATILSFLTELPYCRSSRNYHTVVPDGTTILSFLTGLKKLFNCPTVQLTSDFSC
jgi:hypothetical protein